MVKFALLLLFEIQVLTFVFCADWAAQKKNLNKRMIGHVLYEKYVSGLNFCLYECLFLPVCLSVNYYTKDRLCELNDEDSTFTGPSEIVDVGGTAIINKDDLPEVLLLLSHLITMCAS